MPSDARSPRVGVLSLHESKETKAILNAVEDLGGEPEWLRRENTAVRIDDDGLALEPDVDVVVNRLLLSNTDQPAEALGLASVYDDVRPVLNHPCAVLKALHKFATASTLFAANVPVPAAFLGLDPTRVNEARSDFGDLAIYKSAIGTHGGGTWLIDTDEPIDPMVGNRQAFLQEFVKTAGERHFDYRAYVVGEEVLGAMKRTAREGEFRTNVALGGEVEDASAVLTTRLRRLARRATAAVGLDYAGVDLIERGDEWYVLEVNPTAGFRGFFEATGISPAPYIARLAIERVGGQVDESAVEALAGRLDDAEPASAPVPTSERPRQPATIGYTERVTVSGTHGSESVVAKSDTGASRTSIDLALAARIGAGPIKHRTRVKSGLTKTATARPVVDLVVGIDGSWHTVTASVADRRHMDYPVLLGRDVLQHYHVDVRRLAEE